MFRSRRHRSSPAARLAAQKGVALLEMAFMVALISVIAVPSLYFLGTHSQEEMAGVSDGLGNGLRDSAFDDEEKDEQCKELRCDEDFI